MSERDGGCLNTTATTLRFTKSIGLWLALLALAVFLSISPHALADEVEDAQSKLDGKVAQLQEITDEVNESGEKLASLDAKIAALLEDIAAQQTTRADLQKRIGALSRTLYKSRDDLNVATIIVNAESLSDALSDFEMRKHVLAEYADLFDEQERIGAELEASYQEVSAQKDAQIVKLAQLNAQKDELSEAVAALNERVDELNEAERVALEAAMEAEALAASATGEPELPAAEEPEAAEEQEPVQDEGEPDAEEPEEPDDETNAEESPDGWESGYASAYGGSSDDSIGSEDPTATGAEVDDYSMGVAVPIAWGPEDYYGRSVEITYGDTTVVATVTDCGDMEGGDRSLDLQPGIFKALGFDDCDEWGVREIEYRFL